MRGRTRHQSNTNTLVWADKEYGIEVLSRIRKHVPTEEVAFRKAASMSIRCIWQIIMQSYETIQSKTKWINDACRTDMIHHLHLRSTSQSTLHRQCIHTSPQTVYPYIPSVRCKQAYLVHLKIAFWEQASHDCPDGHRSSWLPDKIQLSCTHQSDSLGPGLRLIQHILQQGVMPQQTPAPKLILIGDEIATTIYGMMA